MTVASSQLAGRERERLSSGGDPREVLSSVGAFVANVAALIATWLFLSSAPPTVLVVIRCHAADRGGCVGAPSHGRTRDRIGSSTDAAGK